MRFLLDMGVHLAVLEWLRAQGRDAVHLREQGLGFACGTPARST